MWSEILLYKMFIAIHAKRQVVKLSKSYVRLASIPRDMTSAASQFLVKASAPNK